MPVCSFEMNAYGVLNVGADSFTHASGPLAKSFVVDTITGTYNLSCNFFDPYAFSRYQVIAGSSTVASTTNRVTTVTITGAAPGVIRIHVKAPFFAKLEGNGTVEIDSSNINDPTTLTISGYNDEDGALFEQNTVIPYSKFTCTYTPTPGYSFSRWSGIFTGNVNPLYDTEYVTTNTQSNPLICVTNVQLTVTQNTGGSIKSSPVGIITSDAALGPVTASFEYGSNITLTATPAPHYSFLYWITPTGNRQQSSLPITINAVESITAVFGQNIVQPVPLNYSPSQSERADSMHICACPCDCTCSSAFTSALNRTRQTRALISGSCCNYIPVTIAIVNAGSNYTRNTILQLQGGVPHEKAALFKVIDINDSGGITSIVPLYGQPYRQKPTDTVLTIYSGAGSGATFTITWASCQSPANLYRQ